MVEAWEGEPGGGPFARAARDLGAALVAQRERWALWLPVLLGVGIGLYFALPVEPAGWIGAAGAVLAAGIAGMGRKRAAVLLPAMGCLAVAAGFAAAQLAAILAAAPVLERQAGPLRVEGRVASVEATARGQRAVLDDLALPAGVPALKRLRLNLGAAEPVRPGERLAVTAILRPPPEPVLPGGFDFARQAWFDGLGAVGFAAGRPERLGRAGIGGPWEALGLGVAALRRTLTERVTTVIDGEAGAVAAALLTGERAAISQATWDAYRDSGLAHLLSISGLHMSMLAGLAFLVVRGALALVPPLALRLPIKKWAAAAALLATFAYLLISGAPVPTQRSFLMIGLVLLAVLIDRTALSMRTVAWAAAAVLLWRPEALVGASFQMSFAAVVALIAAFEAAASKLAAVRGEGGWVRGGLLYVGGIAATTVIAGGATAFYAAHHFSRFASWSVAANLAAVPVTGFVVMPFGMIGLLLVPLGLDEWPLRVAGWGVELVNRVAEGVAGWPAAALTLPAPPPWALAVFSLGGLWLCLWRGRPRLLGLAPIALALLSMPLQRPPDLLVDGRAGLFAVRGADGGLLLSKRGDRLTREDWLERWGGGVPERPFSAAAPADSLHCDSLGCRYRGDVALAWRPEALVEDCRTARVVVSAAPLRHRCPSAQVVVDRFSVWREGAHALWLEPGGARVESVRGAQGRRPWARHRRPAGEEED